MTQLEYVAVMPVKITRHSNIRSMKRGEGSTEYVRAGTTIVLKNNTLYLPSAGLSKTIISIDPNDVQYVHCVGELEE